MSLLKRNNWYRLFINRFFSSIKNLYLGLSRKKGLTFCTRLMPKLTTFRSKPLEFIRSMVESWLVMQYAWSHERRQGVLRSNLSHACDSLKRKLPFLLRLLASPLSKKASFTHRLNHHSSWSKIANSGEREPSGPWSWRLYPVSGVLSGWEILTPPGRELNPFLF